ncbi:hypothetical protein ATCC90586_002016 [Pythium insidiosum]|nr:hypothetical protein ATCC90586_002016 [Pythium insidiosum]
MYGALAHSNAAATRLLSSPRERRSLRDDEWIDEDDDVAEPVEVDHHARQKRLANTFVPVICSIFGVVIFMRLGTIVGTLGLLRAWGVITLAFIITGLSIGSLSALVSSGKAESGKDLFDAVYMEVGPLAGQIVGILMIFAFCIASAYYTLGFAEMTLFYFGVEVDNYTLPAANAVNFACFYQDIASPEFNPSFVLWNIIMEGVEAVTSKWSRIYFISFYFVAVIIVFNLVVAFVVEAYIEQSESARVCNQFFHNTFRRSVTYVQLQSADDYKIVGQELASGENDVREIGRVIYLAVPPRFFLSATVGQYDDYHLHWVDYERSRGEDISAFQQSGIYSPTAAFVELESSHPKWSDTRFILSAAKAAKVMVHLSRRDEPPLVVPEDEAMTRFTAYVRTSHGAEFKLRVCGVSHPAPGRTSFLRAELLAEAPLAALLAPHQHILKVIRMMQATSVERLVIDVQELLGASSTDPSSTATSQAAPTQVPSAEYYTRLMDEISAVGWPNIVGISDDLQSLELQVADAADRRHHIRVDLPHDYPRTAPTCSVDAPEAFQLHWPVAKDPIGASLPSLQTIITQFQAFLAGFQAFWNVLDEIDATCCVLEPHHPTRATGRRRIAVQRHVSIQLEIQPQHPRAICELRFFGNEAAISALRERWTERLFQWEEHLAVPENIERLLDVELPSPRTTAPDEFAQECGICYCYRLDNDDAQEGTAPRVNNGKPHGASEAAPASTIPDRLCDNGRCNRPFHERCLFEWLKALPTARQSFNTVFGECPYCREAISAKFMT